MSGFFTRFKGASLLVALFTLSIFLFYLSARKSDRLTPLQTAVITIMSPFQKSLTWVVDYTSGAWKGYIYLVGVNKENEALKKRINDLEMNNFSLKERLGQYERIERLLGANPKDTGPVEVARVVARDTSGLVRMVTLDKGSDHGLAQNMPVVTHRGLVGRIILTSGGASKVLLITDVRSAVDGLAQKSRDGLVVSGSNSHDLYVRYLRADAKVADGDQVVSSGLGGVYPKGLLIGSLYDIQREKEDLFVTARITPHADLERLEEVLVLKGFIPSWMDFGEKR
ncbi:MAG: rod shape-determining protein MreC [Nitrospinota bacterium]|nr:rod shape-determining protein MreC [Nitrospinota bacterium]